MSTSTPAPPNLTGRRMRAPMDEIGTTGLRHFGGFVLEEWLPRLTGRRGALVWREMSDNDPIVGAFLFAIEMLARSVEWRVEPGDDDRAGEHVEQCMDDMETTWPDFVSEVLSFLVYGWAFHEEVYKRRNGPDAKVPSRYNDGRIGWKKLPIRAQETLMNWVFDPDTGDVVSMVQIAYDGVRRIVPMDKALLFRTSTKRGNPEGRSALRNGYVPWFRKKNIEEVEAIGVDRDLAGIPVMRPPEGFDITAEINQPIVTAARDLVTAIRRDEDEGVLLPDGWDLSLLTTGGSRQLDTDAIIRRYDQRIATTVLADFILLAQDKVGSYALGNVKIDTFGQAMSAWLTMIAEVLNRYAIPRLLRMNGWPVDDPPRIVPGQVGRADIEKIGGFLQTLSLAGAPIPWSELLLRTLFEMADLPEPEDVPEVTTEVGTKPASEPKPEPVDGEAAEGAEPAPDGRSVAKADDGELDFSERLKKHAIAATVLPATRALHPRARVLTAAFRRDLDKAFTQLGADAQAAYLATEDLAKAATADTDPATVANRILAALGIRQWAQRRLGPLYQRHYMRVMRDTLRTLKADVGLETDIPDHVARQILTAGGTQLGLLDVTTPARNAIIRAITDGRANGDGPIAIGRRIRDGVPAGPFTQAGSRYRSELIARTETMNAQRRSALEAYKNADNVTAVALRDGLLASSDDECIGRDGDIVSFDQAEQEAAAEHPLGTLSFDPVVG